MWDCLGSDARHAAWGLLVAAALVAGAGVAEAKVHGTIENRNGKAVERVRITPQGVTITQISPDGVTITTHTSRDSSDLMDSLGVGSLVEDGESSKVRFLSDVRVAPGERVDGDVVAIFGNIRVSGTVTGSAVAVFGSVQIDKHASVGEDAVAVVGSQHSAGQVSGSEVAVLGSLDLQRGAGVGGDAVAVGGRVVDADSVRIAGESVSVSMLPLTLGLPGLSVALGLVLLGWIVTVFFGWLTGVLFPQRLAIVAVTSSRQTFLSIVIAVLSLFLWPMIAVLISCTIVGLPVGILMFLLWPVLVYAGQVSATYVLGCKLLRRRLGEGPALPPVMAGSLLIALFFAASILCYNIGGLGGPFALFFGLVGSLVLAGLTTIGTGALLLSRFGSREREERGGVPGAIPVAGILPS